MRGIYEGYVGWFDGNPMSMYTTPASTVIPELIQLAGGAEKASEFAQKLLAQGDVLKALRLTQGILQVDANNQSALEIQLAGYQALRKQAVNFNEAGWLNYGIKQAENRLLKK